MDFWGIIFFLFGLCVGSFLNVLIYRLPCNLSPLWGRSFCPKCKHKLTWRENIPLFSFIFLGGRCRWCHSPISWQYPLVELATAILFVLLFGLVKERCGQALSCLLSLFFYLYLFSSLIVIFFVDWQNQLIPDKIVLPAILVLGLARWGRLLEGSVILGILAGLGAGVFFLFLFLLTKGKGMGGGDIKLAVLMGLFLGFPKILVALYFAFLTGAALGGILILQGKKGLRDQIPFGPFLVMGTLVSFFWGEQIIKIFLGMI